jgi:hypothetical protein
MKTRVLIFLAALIASAPGLASDNGTQTYAVTITNITPGETFTPLLVVTHRKNLRLFEAGEAASPELATIAESGNIGPMDALLKGMPDRVFSTANSGGLLGPGESVTVEVDTRGNFNRLSVVGMLIPTNDSFVAIQNVALPRHFAAHVVPAYDAGSEFNDELCANIPGPACGGAGDSEEDGEGYVHVSSGIHGIGDLEAASYDWRNPVARISIRRLH